jgi:hypothetical protein
LLAYAAQHRTVGSLDTVVTSYERAAPVPPLSTRLAGALCLLVVRRLRRYAQSPKGDHDGHARGISVYFNSTQSVGPSRHTWRSRSCPGLGSGSWSHRARGGPGAAPGWAAGAGAAGHVAAPELPWDGLRELEPQDTWRPQSCPRLGSGSWSHRARGGPRAHLSTVCEFCTNIQVVFKF